MKSGRRSWWRRWFQKPSYGQALAEVSTPKEVCAMVRKHIRYELWPTQVAPRRTDPLQIWADGYGDCEDMVTLIHAMCMARCLPCRYMRRVVAFTTLPTYQRHAVQVGQTMDGQWWLASNAYYYPMKELSRKEIRLHVSWDMEWPFRWTDIEVEGPEDELAQ